MKWTFNRDSLNHLINDKWDYIIEKEEIKYLLMSNISWIEIIHE